ncbi:MAG: ACP S-malonyltransferase, partial [Schwartzia sp.]|nr:ACP S-malonyltransferase [Schwartzia sp. (in: firmicutes)]
VMGLSREEIVKICEEINAESPVQAVNLNCPGQTVIAGAAKGVEKAVEALNTAGAKKCVLLPVSAPFHSTLMEPAAKKLAVELDKVTLHDARFPVASNYTGKLETKAAEIKENLVLQAAHPVLWEDCVAAMQAFGADAFIEAGPGKTLCGFNKRIDRKIKNMNVEDAASLEKTLDTWKEVR